MDDIDVVKTGLIISTSVILAIFIWMRVLSYVIGKNE
jgi:hypothetical protein